LTQLLPQITNIFRQRGEDAAVAERDRINEELSRQNQRIAFQGPAGGNYLIYFLFDTTTNQEILDFFTPPGIPQEAFPQDVWESEFPARCFPSYAGPTRI
jgi:hypothetical protein